MSRPPDGGSEGAASPGAAGPGGSAGTLVEVLERSRALGHLGPAPVDRHLAHAEVFAEALERIGTPAEARLLDLGSGGGLPGLVLAADPRWRARRWVLLDARRGRAAFLEEAVVALALPRAVVVAERAELVARQPEHRARYDVVVARSFGAPAVTAECAAGLLRVGGRLVVSDPPDLDAEVRWPSTPLADLGLVREDRVEAPTGRVTILRQAEACPASVPRRVGIPAKRPLFHVEHPDGADPMG